MEAVAEPSVNSSEAALLHLEAGRPQGVASVTSPLTEPGLLGRAPAPWARSTQGPVTANQQMGTAAIRGCAEGHFTWQGWEAGGQRGPCRSLRICEVCGRSSGLRHLRTGSPARAGISQGDPAAPGPRGSAGLWDDQATTEEPRTGCRAAGRGPGQGSPADHQGPELWQRAAGSSPPRPPQTPGRCRAPGLCGLKSHVHSSVPSSPWGHGTGVPGGTCHSSICPDRTSDT